ncbi:transposase [Bacteroides sp. 1001136B_160425_E2]|uniref:transposase n=1 Tax=Bacteroides sp. 1001136B_160425_E2 TaxID=2787083 RepID=UPI00293D47A9|nr:transposase [Bacteroides sp. 1001136B_160425_E2]
MTTALIAATAGFSNFDNSKQLSRYLRLASTYEQSGTSVNYCGHINRNGDSSLRGLLYVAAWPASRYNAACKETYTRLRERGKPGARYGRRCQQTSQTGFLRRQKRYAL